VLDHRGSIAPTFVRWQCSWWHARIPQGALVAGAALSGDQPRRGCVAAHAFDSAGEEISATVESRCVCIRAAWAQCMAAIRARDVYRSERLATDLSAAAFSG